MTKTELMAALTVERYQPLPPKPKPEPLGWTPEQQAEHRQILLDALSSDPTVVAFQERRSA